MNLLWTFFFINRKTREFKPSFGVTLFRHILEIHVLQYDYGEVVYSLIYMCVCVLTKYSG